MSRSHRKTPICGITTAKSEAFDKQTWHRAYRHAEKIRATHDPDGEPRHPLEFSNAWVRQKDGKQWLSPDCESRDKIMRK
jgi:hypothetical protein